ncbi:hypothetical protein MJH12_11180, partial [bacterium]|nr:hypothetical protein [bacterium]
AKDYAHFVINYHHTTYNLLSFSDSAVLQYRNAGSFEIRNNYTNIKDFTYFLRSTTNDLRGILIEDSNKATLVNAGGAIGGTPQSMGSPLEDHNNADVSSGWQAYGDFQYKNIGSGTWNSVSSNCDGGKLASIHSEEENKFIDDNICLDAECWIGGQDVGPSNDQNKDWDWVDGTKNTYMNWGGNEPNNNSEDCIRMTKGGSWQDHNCNTNFQRICKKSLSSFENRSEASITLHNGNLFLIGGLNNSGTAGLQANSSIWKSTDGIAWTAIQALVDPQTSVLVASNSLDDNGIMFQDLSSYNHVITKRASPIHDTDETKNNISAMYFVHDSDQSLDLGSSSQWTYNTNNFTLEAWIRPIEDTDDQTIFTNYNNSDNYFSVWLNGGSFLIRSRKGGTAVIDIDITAPAFNTWTHIAVVRVVNEIYVYYNGQYKTKVDFSGSIDYTTNFLIGAWNTNDNSYTWNGHIDQVRVTNGKALYTSDFTPPPMKLTSLPIARYAHQSISFNSKLWIFGGMDSSGDSLNDMWSSSDDGITWVHEGFAAWDARSQHQIIEFGGELWLYGGVGFQDIWKSSNGITWTLVSATSSFGVREYHQVVKHDDGTGSGERLYLLGGYSGGYAKDVWRSSNGSTWALIQGNSPWDVRNRHRVVSYNDGDNPRLILSGGRNHLGMLGNTYSSSDGITWISHGNTSIGDIRDHSTIVHDNKVFTLGGYNGSSYSNEIYSSSYEKISASQVSHRQHFSGQVGNYTYFTMYHSQSNEGDNYTHVRYYKSDGDSLDKGSDIRIGSGNIGRYLHCAGIDACYLSTTGTDIQAVYADTDGQYDTKWTLSSNISQQGWNSGGVSLASKSIVHMATTTNEVQKQLYILDSSGDLYSLDLEDNGDIKSGAKIIAIDMGLKPSASYDFNQARIFLKDGKINEIIITGLAQSIVIKRDQRTGKYACCTQGLE